MTPDPTHPGHDNEVMTMVHDKLEQGWTRRKLLRAGGAGLASAALGTGLAACSNQQTPTTQAGGPVKTPTYVPFKGPKPDLPGTAEGVAPGYYTYPGDPPRSVSEAPANGATTSAMLITFTPPPKPEADNADWQEIEKRIGSKLTLNLVSPADYQAKFSTMMAGNDLPDLFLYTSFKPVPHLPEFLKAKCAELTPHLAGDGVKAWPNLANIPTQIWQNSAVNGKIYGIPTPTPLFGSGHIYYHDMLDEAGAALPTNADDFLQLLKQMTSKKAGRWGFVGAGGPFALSFCQSMWKVPPNWQVDGSGKLTKDIETPENKEALAFTTKLFQAGVFYPGMQGFSNPQRKNIFNAGKAFMTSDGFTALGGYWRSTVRKQAQLKVMMPPGHDGGKGRATKSSGFYSTTLIKKGSEDRVKELLGITNFFASPFGTEEYLLLNYGVEGTGYTLDDKGNPVQTSRGKAELPTSDNPWPYFIAHGPTVIFNPTSREYVQVAHQAMVNGIPISEGDPTLGLYSSTATSKNATLSKTVEDAVTEIVAGRRPMSDYDKIVADWRSGGGDQMRKEFEEAWQQAHG